MSKQATIEEKFDALFKRIDTLEKRVVELETENKYLKARLSKYETPKNSGNSNRPPSSDFPRQRKTNSLRGSSGKKPGGQPGHKGNTLKMVETPDITNDHMSNNCSGCGKDLSGLPFEFIGKRQVIDIPPIHPIITEHRIYKQTCTCGKCNETLYPDGVNAPVSYGSSIQSLVPYLNVRQYIPIARSAEILNHVFNVPISTGGICHLLKKVKKKALGTYENIRQTVLNGTVIGGDETGVNINGKNNWAWTFQNPIATYIGIHESRGSKAITDLMPEGFQQNVLITDCWAPYFKIGALSHQVCTAHLQRELKYFKQCYPENTWIRRLDALIENALDLRRKDQLTPKKIREIKLTFSVLIKEPLTNEQIKELITFQKRMVKYEDYVFGFLDNPDITPDNNASERAIRNFKVKLKNSGFFKTIEGANIYAVIRSIVDTAIKNDQNPYFAMKLLADNN